jgi:DNA-directed RNA polymerase sigma subunit (sigma70/sigma32)
MISGLEQNLIKIRNTAALIAVNLLKGYTIEEIANKLQVSQKEVTEIQRIIKEVDENFYKINKEG